MAERVIDRALRWAKEKGWNQTEFAARMGVAPQNLTNWKARDLPSDLHAKAAEVLSRTVDQLLGRVPDTPLVSQPAAPYESTLAPILAWEHPDELPQGEFVLIPRLDTHLSAGHGREQIELDFLKQQPQAFRADWIREERLKPKHLACMNASGRSMEPAIFDKDSLVVDTSAREVADGKVYALWYEGGERVKRLFRLPGGGLRIQSDNPEFPPIVLDAGNVDHVRIIGRVVHRSGKGGL